ncbi:MAG: hypothetical protein Q9226_002289 [Calogaya cf. arnoldii]
MHLSVCYSWALFALVTSRSVQDASDLPKRLSHELTTSAPFLEKRDDYSDAVAKGKSLWALLQAHCDKEVTEPSLAKLKELNWDIIDADKDDEDEETAPAEGSKDKLEELGIDTCTPFWQPMIWEDTCKNVDETDPKSLKYIFQDNIVNKATPGFIDNVGIKAFKPGEEGFFALLGSENGKGAAYLLIQHSGILDKKTIKEIVTYKSGDGSYQMYLELEEWKKAAVPGACTSTEAPNDV